MSNRTYICTDCRIARRAEAAYWLPTDLRCAGCGGELWELCRKWRIPRKGDDRAWTELGRMVDAERPLRRELLNKRGKELLESVEKRLRTTELHPSPATRKRLSGPLKKRREEILHYYFR